MGVELPPDYRPSEDEPFMNERQREYFRRKLLAWREELLEDYEETRSNLSSRERSDGDEADQTSGESELAMELRFRGRERKLLAKIEQALARIAEGTYGYCFECGDEISERRLRALPFAVRCKDCEEAREIAEQRERQQMQRRSGGFLLDLN